MADTEFCYPQSQSENGYNRNGVGRDGKDYYHSFMEPCVDSNPPATSKHRKRLTRDSSRTMSYGGSSVDSRNVTWSVLDDDSIKYAEASRCRPLTPPAQEHHHSPAMASLKQPLLDNEGPTTSSPVSSPSRGVGRCRTAPGGYENHDRQAHDDMLLNCYITERMQNQKSYSKARSVQLDRLSEREKMKLIENLAKIKNDGRVEVDVDRSAPVASELLGIDVSDTREVDITEFSCEENKVVPKLNIAMLIVGTRGDVQPFLAIAKRLQEYGHRVRLATHDNFRSFVTSSGIEFYPLGGDPRALAGYMVRNKGFLPSAPSEISFQRKQLHAIINSLLPACTEPDIDTGVPFRAQAIIANPPSYGHVHVAEALRIPLHIFFTMPWTPTIEFPHPLARVPQSAGYWLSYFVVDLLIWWGLRSIINEFRKKKLKLSPIAYLSSYHGSIADLPTGYMWSPHLVPKPKDWGHLVDVVGFCFLNLGNNYNPSRDFLQWLEAGSKPIYFGFGSMPLEDPVKTTGVILEALKITGQRGIIDKGWGNLGNCHETPEYVYLLEDCPHDWLFPQCSAVVHHGGAGTTATGLRAGCPTTIVPFFGDQYFWGDRVYDKRVGPAPIPMRQLTTDALVQAIEMMLDPQVKERALELGQYIEQEDGIVAAVNAFHKHLPPTLPEPMIPSEQPNIFQSFLMALHRCFCVPWIS